MKCEFHVEGSSQHWSETRDTTPQIGDEVERRGHSYTVTDVSGFVGEDLASVTVRGKIDEPAMV